LRRILSSSSSSDVALLDDNVLDQEIIMADNGTPLTMAQKLKPVKCQWKHGGWWYTDESMFQSLLVNKDQSRKLSNAARKLMDGADSRSWGTVAVQFTRCANLDVAAINFKAQLCNKFEVSTDGESVGAQLMTTFEASIETGNWILPCCYVVSISADLKLEISASIGSNIEYDWSVTGCVRVGLDVESYLGSVICRVISCHMNGIDICVRVSGTSVIGTVTVHFGPAYVQASLTIPFNSNAWKKFSVVLHTPEVKVLYVGPDAHDYTLADLDF